MEDSQALTCGCHHYAQHVLLCMVQKLQAAARHVSCVLHRVMAGVMHHCKLPGDIDLWACLPCLGRSARSLLVAAILAF